MVRTCRRENCTTFLRLLACRLNVVLVVDEEDLVEICTRKMNSPGSRTRAGHTLREYTSGENARDTAADDGRLTVELVRVERSANVVEIGQRGTARDEEPRDEPFSDDGDDQQRPHDFPVKSQHAELA